MILRLHGMLLVPPTSPPEVDASEGPVVPVVPARMSRELAHAFEVCGSCTLLARVIHEQLLEFEIRGPGVELRLRFGLDDEHAARLWARALDPDGEAAGVRIVLCPNADSAIRLSLARFSPDPSQLLDGCCTFEPAQLAIPDRGVAARPG